MTPRGGAFFAAILLAGCAVQDPLLPPLARVSVPAVETRPVPAPPPKPEPASLVGRTEKEVMAFLGTPDLARREAPAEIWRYGDATCGIHLFFYHDGDGLKVTHVETQLGDKGPETPAQCLDDLRRPGADPLKSP